MAAPMLPPIRLLSWPLRDVISFCVQNFVPVPEHPLLSDYPRRPRPQMCGAWVEALPELAIGGDAEPLPSAIKALGVTLAAFSQTTRAPIPDALEAQCAAIGTLQSAIRDNTVSPSNELAATIMCLFVSEVKLHDSSMISSWMHDQTNHPYW